MTDTNRTDVDRLMEVAVRRGGRVLEQAKWPMVDQDTEPAPWPQLATATVLDAISLRDILAAGEAMKGTATGMYTDYDAAKAWDAATEKLREGAG